MFHDRRHAVRTLAKHPAFLALATVVLALGIGLNTALFSIVRALLFTPFPVAASDELVSIYQIFPRQPDRPIVLASPQFEFLDLHNEVFTGLTAQWNIGSSLRAADRTEVINLGRVRSNYSATVRRLGRGDPSWA
jgi:hypothetical protein